MRLGKSLALGEAHTYNPAHRNYLLDRSLRAGGRYSFAWAGEGLTPPAVRVRAAWGTGLERITVSRVTQEPYA
jgi:hypothetical protein